MRTELYHEATADILALVAEQVTAERAKNADAIQIMREALAYYAANHEWPNEGPWGADSSDFGNVARTALDKVSKL